MSGRRPVVAIDGPAGAGKSTVARALARRLGYRFLDTGGMYRAVAWSVRHAGLPPVDGPALRRHLAALSITVEGERIRIDGRDVTDELRTPELTELTSRLTTLAAVRDAVTPLQRALAARGGIILEGRDTGTVVCPDAEVKFYLDASLETRVQRRWEDLARSGVRQDRARVRTQVEARDRQDTERALAPLRRAPEAIVVDTSALTVDQVVDIMADAVVGRRECSTSS